MRLSLVSAVVAATLIAQSTTAEPVWTSARGERLFGPEISEAAACRDAERAARLSALRQTTGEVVTASDLSLCEEHRNADACTLNQMTWSQSAGMITGLRNLTREIDENSGLRRCTVTLDAEVRTLEGETDPNFDLVASLNQAVFRDGEALKVRVEPTQPMHVTLFQWQPNITGPNAVQRIFPNRFDTNTAFETRGTIPKQGGYRFTLEFPKTATDQRLADEFIIVVATKQPVTFAETYPIDLFQLRLTELDRSTTSLSRHGYAIARE